MDKDFIIKTYVNNIRIQNKKKEFNPNYNSKEVSKTFSKEVKEEVLAKEVKEVKEVKGKVIYGDSWDLI
jgi:hypothetical protein